MSSTPPTSAVIGTTGMLPIGALSVAPLTFTSMMITNM
jgi:hypothetical protein